MQVTVGLDFGTHQSKVCIEKIEGRVVEYSFLKFENEYRREFYTLPSIINIGEDGLLTYGYLPRNIKGERVRYFKQAAFCTNSIQGLDRQKAMFYSCWYLAYILFDLEERYGQTFTVQMGAPTDSGHLRDAKRTAVRILGSAYNLVENVFKNDKAAFLATDIYKLEEMTTILPYSKALKEDCGILVFPEAYACLKPLTSRGRIAEGMNLMVDIGGGTTDISFFTIEPEDEENKSKVKIPQVYDFLSIDKGLNFLTMARADDKRDDSDSNVKSSREINEKRLYQYRKEMDSVCRNLILRLHTEFHQQSSLSASALENALKNRPIIYCGGGSTFKILRKKYANFSECLQVSEQEWDRKSVVDMDEIIRLGLCPILSTAYGLSIHAKSDSIKCKPFKDIFDKDGLRNKTQGYNSYNNDNHYRSVYDDWDAIK